MTSHRRFVYFLNNYPVSKVLDAVRAKELGSQHAWGYTQLATKYDWEHSARYLVGRRPRNRRVMKCLTGIMAVVGDPLQQFSALRKLPRDGLIYAADQQSATFLCLLRRFGLIQNPIVVLVHNGPRMRWSRFCLRGADRILALHATVAPRMDLQDADVTVLPWGPDLESDVYREIRGAKERLNFVAAGKTNRDYKTLHLVALGNKLDGMIFEHGVITTYQAGRPSVERKSATARQVVEAISRSNCVIVALEDLSRLSGLTEAADAIALKVPMVITSGAMVPYGNHEQIRYVDTTDQGALMSAIQERWPVTRSPSLSDLYNMQRFSAALDEVFQGVI